MWAVMVEYLIAHGHSNAIKYSPRQALAFYELAIKRQKTELAGDFSVFRMAQHADKNKANEFLKGLTNG